MLNTKARNDKTRKILAVLMAVVVLVGLLIMPAYAENELAQKGANWILEGLSWVIFVVAVLGLIKLFMSRNFAGMITTILAAGLTILVCQKPEILKTIANMFSQQLGL